MKINRTAIIIYAAIVILIVGLVGLMFYPALSYASTIAALPLDNNINTTTTPTPTNIIIPTPMPDPDPNPSPDPVPPPQVEEQGGNVKGKIAKLMDAIDVCSEIVEEGGPLWDSVQADCFKVLNAANSNVTKLLTDNRISIENILYGK
jgi:hypothetical protein